MGEFIFGLKRILLATIGLLSIASFQPAKSALFTHNLQYTPKPGDNSGNLTGQITFESTQGSATNFTTEFGGAVSIDRNLITNVTFTYTPDGGDPVTLSNADITGFRLIHASLNNTDYAAANIKGEFSTLQFFSNTGSFSLDPNDATYGLEAADDDDFTLETTTYHSPGPLPLFGLFTAFSAIKKLKSRYKAKFG